jgi:two-component system CheB/CheR fusion protein
MKADEQEGTARNEAARADAEASNAAASREDTARKEAPREETAPEETESEAPPEGWAELLDFLRGERGFDFGGYKPSSLMRRVRKRVEQLRLGGFAEYRDYLHVHPDEFETLFNTILINVTCFFRDPAAWEALRTQVLPQLLAGKRRDEPIRVWSAGSASGEEAYTLAILFAEALGLDGYRERVKIYATDIDEEALALARHAAYSPRQAEGVPAELVDRYFERGEHNLTFRKDLRRQVIFGHHNLLQDAPISHIDLLVCRNTLMYFNAETQAQILARFHFALNDGGFLFLGRAETLMAHGQSFVPVDLKRRISMKAGRRHTRSRLAVLGLEQIRKGLGAERDGGPLHESALDATPVATLLVDTAGQLRFVNERARALFDLGSGDIGRPLQDLRISYRPVELRSVLEQVAVERRAVHVRDVEWHTGPGEVRWLDLQICPLLQSNGESLGTAVMFTDVTAYKRLQRELEHSNQELETADEELQSTNEALETTNEELQSTVEELETTNEELQSTNEELETMNEELQSTNEELQTINDELRQRSDDLNLANAFLESVLASLSGGVVVVDRELRLLGWNRQSEELWGLRADEVEGKHLLNLDIGLPVQQLRQPLRACLAGESEPWVGTLDAVNRRGKAIRCQIHCSPLIGAHEDIRGAILLAEVV